MVGTAISNARRAVSRNPNRVPIPIRRLVVGIAALVAVMLVLPASLAAYAATTASYSGEEGQTGIAARDRTSLLDDTWQASVLAHGGKLAEAPLILPSGTILSLPPARDGTTTRVTRTRYTTEVIPAYVADSLFENHGTGECVAYGATAGAGL